MRLLLVPSMHPMLEADDCLMWDKLGLRWFSTGFYAYKNKPGDLPDIQVDERLRKLFLGAKIKKRAYPGDRPGSFNAQKNLVWTKLPTNNRIKLTERFLDEFEVVVFHHFVDSIYDNLALLKNKTVILKTYAMHSIHDETRIQKLRDTIGLKVVRNSFTECNREGYCGHDVIIHSSVIKDEYEVSGWTGIENKVCTFTSFMSGYKPRHDYYNKIKDALNIPTELYGVKNEPIGKFISHDEKIKILQNYRINLVTGTPNATNTYSMVEAWIMGQPVVCFGSKMWESPTYELYNLIENEKTGFIGESPEQCTEYIKELSNNIDLCNRISITQRDAAIKIYGRDILAKQWKIFFTELGHEI